jgi:CheY-like chemotaxis protein
MIQASIERQLRGKVEYDWRAVGLTVTLEVPHEHIFSSHSDEDERSAPEPAAIAKLDPPSACRVLLVEDEAMIGLQLEQALEAKGCQVVGVATNVDEALTLIDCAHPEGAVLDVNLGGERSFPIADRLRGLGVPFVFCTGYAAETVIPDRFQDVPLLRKPFDPDSIAEMFVENQQRRAD